ncbi:MAG: hypothetical protein SNJ60_08715, partial [Pseudanabaenaceae cyanobacterium]
GRLVPFFTKLARCHKLRLLFPTIFWPFVEMAIGFAKPRSTLTIAWGNSQSSPHADPEPMASDWVFLAKAPLEVCISVLA